MLRIKRKYNNYFLRWLIWQKIYNFEYKEVISFCQLNENIIILLGRTKENHMIISFWELKENIIILLGRTKRKSYDYFINFEN